MPKPPTLSLQVNNRLLITVLSGWLVIAVLVMIGLVAFYRSDQVYSAALKQVEALQASALNLNAGIVTEMLNTRAYLISGEDSAATRRRLAHQQIEDEFATLQGLLAAQPALRAPSLAKMLALHAEYDGVAGRLFELRRAGQIDQALSLFDAQSDPLVLAIQDTSRDLQNEIQQGVQEMNAGYTQAAGQAVWLGAAIFLVWMAVGSIVLLRWIAPLLRTLDYFETSLINAAETQVYQPVAGGAAGTGAPGGLLEAYNHLMRRLQESSTAVTQYVRHMHHELNTLLASVIGYASMLADPELRPADASPEEYSQIIVQQARRAINLADDFTLAARIEGSQYAPVLLPVRLSALLSALVDDLRAEAARAGQPAEIRLGDCPPGLVVLADALGLENALRKLIENALKFSPPGRPVDVTVETCPRPRGVLIHVADQGPGIAAEDLPRLFKPFSRIQNEAARRIPGNGLGLYLAQSILRAHHGSLVVESRVGAGSVFTIRLPLEEG